MDDAEVSKEVQRLTEEEKKEIFKHPEKIEFSPMQGITIDPSEVSSTSAPIPTKSDSLEVTISNILTQYNEKYGTKFESKSVSDTLTSLVNVSTNEREIRRLIDSQIITNVTEILTTKSILVISKVVSEQLDRISLLTESDGLNAELVSLVGEIFGWIDKLEEIKNKYRLYDVDSKIKSLIKGESSANLVRTEEQEKALESLKKLLIK